jgi:translation initiation factor IF-2
MKLKKLKMVYECGMALENFNDIKVDDLIEAYIMEQKQRKLEASAQTL